MKSEIWVCALVRYWQRICCYTMCFFVSLNKYWGVTGRDFLTSEPRGTHPRLRITGIPSQPFPPHRACDDLTLTHRVKYVASYTDLFLFLFEWTYNYPV